jgi:hypothetical protein
MEADASPDPPTRSVCDLCGIGDRIYRCPRCFTGTCSLACCRQHKISQGCDGKRDRTLFVGLSDFSTSQLQSDYLFLEDVLRTMGAAKRTAEDHESCGSTSRPGNRKRPRKQQSADAAAGIMDDMGLMNLESHSAANQNLVRKARLSGINLQLMPPGMEKRRLNSTRVRKGEIFWRVEWVFALAVGGPYTVVVNDISGKDVLGGALALALGEGHSGALPLRQRLLKYCEVPREELRLYIMKLPRQACSPRWIALAQQQTLSDALRNSTVIEYPQIYVSCPEEVAGGAYPGLIETISIAELSSEEGELQEDRRAPDLLLGET